MSDSKKSQRRNLCFGIDVGGTFTDCVLTEGDRVWRAKSPTTPGAIGEGVINAARLASERRGEALEDTLPQVARFGLGTTVVTNVLASRTGRRVGLITTRGFEKMIPLARGERAIDEDGWLVTQPSLLDPAAIVGVRERIDPAAVEADLAADRFTKDEAKATFGVVAGDAEATLALREALRSARLAKAAPPAKALSSAEALPPGEALPLFPGVVQYGHVAVAEASGARLARAPDHWTMGCACLIQHLWPKGQGPEVIYRSWLDPLTGRALHVEAVVEGDTESFLVAPRRWTEAQAAGVA